MSEAFYPSPIVVSNKAPPLSKLGLPKEHPTIFNLTKPILGLFHLTFMTCFLLTSLVGEAQYINSLATAQSSLFSSRFRGEFLNTTLFLWSQRLQIAKEKYIFQGMDKSIQLEILAQFFFPATHTKVQWIKVMQKGTSLIGREGITRGGCTYTLRGSNEPLTWNYIHIYIYIYIALLIYFTLKNIFTHPDHISIYPTIKQQLGVLFMYGWVWLYGLMII